MPEEIKIRLTLDDSEARKNLEDTEGSGIKRSQGGLFRKRSRESADAEEQRKKSRFPALPGLAKLAISVPGIKALAQSITVLAPLVAEAVVEIISSVLPEQLANKVREAALSAVEGLVDVIQSGQAKLGAGTQTIQQTKDLLRALAGADRDLTASEIKEVATTLFEVSEFRIRNDLEVEELLQGARGRQAARVVMGFLFGGTQKDSVDGFEENAQDLIKNMSWFGGAGR